MHESKPLNPKHTRSIFSGILSGLLLLALSFAPNPSFAQTQASVDLAQQMYVAYYGRAGDPGGVSFWAGRFDESGNLDAVLSNFGLSQEYSDNFGSLSHEELVSGLFQQMFNRDPDAAGLEFYVGRLESGAATLASIAKQIADGAQDDDGLSLDNKIAVANSFTDRVEAESLDYASDDIDTVRALLASVTSLASSVDTGLAEVTNWVPQSQTAASGNVVMTTNYGVIELEMFPEQAPITVANFLAYVESGFYDSLIFHRVIRDFMIQGGGFDITGAPQTTLAPIELETNNQLSNLRGTIAMARTSVPDSATSQFFINHVDNTFLDATGNDDGYAVFGQVVEGLDVVDTIANLPTTRVGSFADLPVEPVIIESVVVASAKNASLAAKAGPDQTVEPFQAVYLNGSASASRDGNTLDYSWELVSAPSGSEAVLYSSSSANPYFTPDIAGTYVFELSLSDGSLSRSLDRVVVRVSE